MKVEELMTRETQTCTPETNLVAAAMRMWEGDCGTLPVLTDGGRVVGMITDRDICIAAATKHRAPAEIAVSEAITGNVSRAIQEGLDNPFLCDACEAECDELAYER